ncbi:sphingosine 1-phosphate receptor 2 [Callorhinchus milii]|uniref:Sphingosine-1-phosphate receptor 2 n=1 Tax=Callorhinchus milii TaxID=7868 RepID=A0A4W3HH49_CALMI|nr:sphingosine 1-phosphate receptor 2 [Callorhinchus milii]XP_007905313.1 sphingosine 1-phosphate receptor 2 [Callorhinchus milii]XP_007905315.1 sphingosine 1-phosphate receptor 2 [Callorhinchus milii]XP_007905316.1 sphingosine 1-phosphate receptor 2 [Callorhinchus milii]XP_042200654.1 sphingosine 1-phosphate receptor 2 [Callorhinchus milii]|eukprot:gi/632977376/ref/XP_007905309.1/ PREDICTED: sphingosine 1-phosphate receptor 2 [Callorhinchus milii]
MPEPYPAETMSTLNKYYNKHLIAVHYNHTGKLDHSKYQTMELSYISIFFIVLCSFIVLENLLVLVAICRYKKFHSAMFYFIGNLALSDLLAGLAYIFNVVFSGGKTLTLTPLQWFVREGTMFITLAASVFSLLAIAIERHAAIVQVKLYGSEKNSRMCLLISGCWILSMLLGGMPLMGWNCMDDLLQCSIVLPLYSKRYILFVLTVLTVILLSIVILYVRIYLIVRSSHHEAAASQNLALLKTVTIVLGVFIVCWAPAFIILLFDVACMGQACKILYKAEYFLGLATLNSAMNPIIYTLRSKDMRRAFLKVICCCGFLGDGWRPEKCLLALRSTSTSERSYHRHESPDSPMMPECTTCV